MGGPYTPSPFAGLILTIAGGRPVKVVSPTYTTDIVVKPPSTSSKVMVSTAILEYFGVAVENAEWIVSLSGARVALSAVLII